MEQYSVQDGIDKIIEMVDDSPGRPACFRIHGDSVSVKSYFKHLLLGRAYAEGLNAERRDFDKLQFSDLGNKDMLILDGSLDSRIDDRVKKAFDDATQIFVYDSLVGTLPDNASTYQLVIEIT